MTELRQLTQESLNAPTAEIYGKGEADVTHAMGPAQAGTGAMGPAQAGTGALAAAEGAETPTRTRPNPWANAASKTQHRERLGGERLLGRTQTQSQAQPPRPNVEGGRLRTHDQRDK